MERLGAGWGQSARATRGRPLRPLFPASGRLAFCPVEGGSEELVGVFGGDPKRASSSATRAASTLFCSASASTSRFNASLSSESSVSGAIPSLNQALDKCSTPPTRVKPPHQP